MGSIGAQRRSVAYIQGMLKFPCRHRVLLKEFGQHAERTTQQVKQASLEEAEQWQVGNLPHIDRTPSKIELT